MHEHCVGASIRAVPAVLHRVERRSTEGPGGGDDDDDVREHPVDVTISAQRARVHAY